MIKNLLAVVLLLGYFNVNAQNSKGTCLEEYQKEFKERGCSPVDDGNHLVIVSITTETGTDCYEAKAKVENNYVIAIYMSYEDGSFEFLDRKYKGPSKAKIVNGISDALITTDTESIQVVFVNKILPKKKQFKKAKGPGKDF